MRIGVDTSVLSTDVASSGSRLMRQVLAALEPIASDGLIALHPSGAVPATGRVRNVVGELASRHVPMTRRQSLVWQQWQLPRQAVHEGVDTLHCVYHEVPLFVPRTISVTSTIHDLCGLRPDCGYRFFGRARTQHYWRLWTAARRADGFVYVSARTEAEYIGRFPSAGRRPSVVAPWFLEQTTATDQQPIRRDIQRYTESSYFVAFAYVSPRKGTDILAKAFDSYRRRGGASSLVLILSGISPERASASFHQHQDHVHLVEQVNDAERDLLFRHARALLFPSRCEGFGLPLLEALRQGTWPIAFRQTPAEEIVGNEDVLAAYANPASFAEKMLDMDLRIGVLDASQEKTSRARAMQRAGEFDDKRYGAAVARLYAHLSESKAKPVPGDGPPH